MSFKRPLHVVLNSSKARGRWAFLDSRNLRKVERWLAVFASKYGVRVYQKAINWNHLHLVVRFPNRESYCGFIRALSGTIPKVVFEFSNSIESFWDCRPFTRVIEWGRDYRGTCSYVHRNTLEALGMMTYKARVDRYAKWLKEIGAVG